MKPENPWESLVSGRWGASPGDIAHQVLDSMIWDHEGYIDPVAARERAAAEEKRQRLLDKYSRQRLTATTHEAGESSGVTGLTMPDSDPGRITDTVVRKAQVGELKAIITALASADYETGSDEWEDGYQTALAIVQARLEAYGRGEAPE